LLPLSPPLDHQSKKLKILSQKSLLQFSLYRA
jgi:hypothetical protein